VVSGILWGPQNISPEDKGDYSMYFQELLCASIVRISLPPLKPKLKVWNMSNIKLIAKFS
jgi:hypothetical protein